MALFLAWANPIKLSTTVIYGFSYQARVFVAGKPFHPSLIFGGKTEVYPSEAPFKLVGHMQERLETTGEESLARKY